MRRLRAPSPPPWGWEVLRKGAGPFPLLTPSGGGIEASCDRIAASVDVPTRQRVHEALVRRDPRNEELLGPLLDPRSVVLLTGQQPMLLGGPMMVAAKLATAVLAARSLQDRLDRPIVPIFWNHSEDHDLDEVNRFHVWDRGQARRMRLRGLASGRCLDSLELGEEHRQALEAWARRTAAPVPSGASPVGFAEHSWTWLREAVGPALRVAVAEPRPLWPLAPAILSSLLLDHAAAHADLARGTARVAALGGRLQVHLPGPQHSLLFAREADGRRRRLLRRPDGSFGVEGEADAPARSSEDLLAAELSASALARPVLTQALLPVLAHVVGPAEAAYFQQVPDLFDRLGLPRPALLPRARMTVLSSRAKEAAAELGLEESRLLGSPATWGESDAMWPEAVALHRAFRTLVARAESERPLTEDHHLRFQGRIHQLVADLSKHTERTPARRSERRLMHGLREWMTPFGRPQERILGPGVLFSDPERTWRALSRIDPFFDGIHLEDDHG